MTEIQQQTLIVTLNFRKAVAVATPEDAVSICGQFRDGYDYGFGMGATRYYNLGIGRVFDGAKQIAQVHYNGRIEMVTA